MCFPAIGAAMAGYGSTAAATAAGMSSMSLGLIGASTVAGIASPLVSYAGQQKQAKQQRRYQAQAAEAERQRFIQEQSALRMRQAQEQEALHTELGDIALKSREAISRYGVSAGEAGVSGASVAMGGEDLTREWLNYSTRVTRQQELRNINAELALTDAGYRTMQNQIGIGKPVQGPSWLTTGLGAVKGFTDAKRLGMEIKRMES
jgi:hypothetical protein